MELDKTLVKEGRLNFKKNNLFESFVLTDDGIVDHYKGTYDNDGKMVANMLAESFPFSKLKLNRITSLTLNEGYELDTLEEASTEEIEQTTEEIKDQIDKVDQAQELKDELETKMDKLVNESRQIEEISFDEIISRMEQATDYSELYDAAALIANESLRVDVEELIGQCEEDEDAVDVAYSVVTTDLLDSHINDENVENLKECKKVEEAKEAKEDDKEEKPEVKVEEVAAFEPNEFSERSLGAEDLDNIEETLKKELDSKQKKYIEDNICDIDTFALSFKDMLKDVIDIGAEISVDNYIASFNQIKNR